MTDTKSHIVTVDELEKKLYSGELKFIPVDSKKNTYKLNKKICFVTPSNHSENDTPCSDYDISHPDSPYHDFLGFNEMNETNFEKCEEYDYYEVSFASTEYRDNWTFNKMESSSEEIKNNSVPTIKSTKEITKFSDGLFPLIVKMKDNVGIKCFTYYQIKGYKIGKWTVDLKNNKIWKKKD